VQFEKIKILYLGAFCELHASNELLKFNSILKWIENNSSHMLSTAGVIVITTEIYPQCLSALEWPIARWQRLFEIAIYYILPVSKIFTSKRWFGVNVISNKVWWFFQPHTVKIDRIIFIRASSLFFSEGFWYIFLRYIFQEYSQYFM